MGIVNFKDYKVPRQISDGNLPGYQEVVKFVFSDSGNLTTTKNSSIEGSAGEPARGPKVYKKSR